MYEFLSYIDSDLNSLILLHDLDSENLIQYGDKMARNYKHGFILNFTVNRYHTRKSGLLLLTLNWKHPEGKMIFAP